MPFKMSAEMAAITLKPQSICEDHLFYCNSWAHYIPLKQWCMYLLFLGGSFTLILGEVLVIICLFASHIEM